MLGGHLLASMGRGRRAVTLAKEVAHSPSSCSLRDLLLPRTCEGASGLSSGLESLQPCGSPAESFRECSHAAADPCAAEPAFPQTRHISGPCFRPFRLESLGPSDSSPGATARMLKSQNCSAWDATAGSKTWQYPGAPFGQRRHYQSRRLSIVTATANGRKAFFVDTLALVSAMGQPGL